MPAAVLDDRGVPYPSRPRLRPLPQFAGTATSRPSPELLERLVAFVLAEYAAGRSLREIAGLTDRSFSAVRNILASRGVSSFAVDLADDLVGDAGPGEWFAAFVPAVDEGLDGADEVLD